MTDPMLLSLAATCRREREAARQTLKEVADAAGVDQSSVWRFEQAQAWPKDPDAVVGAYADVLETSPSALWERAYAGWLNREHCGVARLDVAPQARQEAVRRLMDKQAARLARVEHQLTRAALAPDRRLLDAFFGVEPIGVALVDPQLRVQWINRPLRALLGANQDRVTGRTLAELLPDLPEYSREAPFRQVLASGGRLLSQEITATVRGEERHYLASLCPLRSERSTVAVVCLLLDTAVAITPRTVLPLASSKGDALPPAGVEPVPPAARL